MKTVFVVEHGEIHAGGGVVGVFDSYEKAKRAALNTRTSFEGGWVEEENRKDSWINGCDYVFVSEKEVK